MGKTRKRIVFIAEFLEHLSKRPSQPDLRGANRTEHFEPPLDKGRTVLEDVVYAFPKFSIFFEKVVPQLKRDPRNQHARLGQNLISAQTTPPSNGLFGCHKRDRNLSTVEADSGKAKFAPN